MTSHDLERLIYLEIEENEIDNWHDIKSDNIGNHLVKPYLKEFITGWNGELKEYWLVLDEEPGNSVHGYQIVYDQEESMFGLATKSGVNRKDIGEMIGLYGSFITTLNGM